MQMISIYERREKDPNAQNLDLGAQKERKRESNVVVDVIIDLRGNVEM